MKVRCEYCQNMVEAGAGADKICPFCGSPLPAAPAPEVRAGRAAVPGAGQKFLPVFSLAAVVLIFAIASILLRNSTQAPASSQAPGAAFSVSDALSAVNGGGAGGEAYQVVISYHLDSGRPDTAYQTARELMERPGGGSYMDWCVREFISFERRDLAARLAMAGDALSGERTLYPLVAETPLPEILSDSPLCQAMELVLGRTAERITLADLQTVTGLSIDRRDTLTGAQNIGVAFDEAGADFTVVTVEYTGQGSGLGTVCFQGLRRFSLNDTNIRTKEDLFLPNLRELYINLRMDAENLTKFGHLKKLERLRLGGPSLTSLEGLDQLEGLTALTLFDTGLTDLSVLAARSRITELGLLDNDRLTSVASLSQASHLKRLTLSGAALADLSPLASLTGLEELSVTGTSIRDTAFLAGMTGLKSLTLTGNKELGTVPELARLSGLEALTLDSDEMFAAQKDMEGLTSLRALKLRVTKKLTFLQPLSGAEELTVYTYQTSLDLSPLAGWTGLKKLSFHSGSSFYDSYTTHLEGLSALKKLPLEELDLTGKSFYEPIDPVLEIPSLQVLHLNGASSKGTDYRKFSNLKQLRELDLGGYRDMRDVPPGPHEQYWSYEAGPASAFVDRLGALTGLERLDLSGCGAGDVSALAGLTGLTWLDLSDNNISDLSPLAGLEALAYLRLSGNRIADYTPVEGRSGLTLIR